MRYNLATYDMQRTKLLLKYVLAIAWMIIIFFLSAEGADDSRERSGMVVSFLKDYLNVGFAEDTLSFMTRKAAHVIAYFILGLLIYSIIRSYKFTTKRTITLSIIFTMLYAVLDEVHQLFVIGRSGEIRDIFIDTFAASIGIAIYYLYSKLRAR